MNSPDGRLRLGKNVFMPDGTSIKGNAVEVGNSSNVYRVFAKSLKTGFEVNIRAGAGGAFTLPVATPFCVIPSFTCGGGQIDVLPRGEGPPAGTYGIVRVMDGRTLRLDAGPYTVCDVRLGRESRVEGDGAVTLQIDGCYCSDRSKSDKHITLSCRVQ